MECFDGPRRTETLVPSRRAGEAGSGGRDLPFFEKLAAPGALFVGGTRALASAAAPYSLKAVTGEELQGGVEFYEPPRGWCVTVASWNEALFWLTIEGASGAHEVQLWISIFNIPRARVEALRDRWTQVLEGLFPTSA